MRVPQFSAIFQEFSVSVKQEDEDNETFISPNVQSFLSNRLNRIYYLNEHGEDLKKRDLEELMNMVASIINRCRKH